MHSLPILTTTFAVGNAVYVTKEIRELNNTINESEFRQKLVSGKDSVCPKFLQQTSINCMVELKPKIQANSTVQLMSQLTEPQSND
ncbi:MAG: hypothetical protein BGO59_29740 [Spirosoma sp. 48-14]|nr:MAG: hypothetical protein BGO59_29740 [Spirosoma sp. 48-14]